MPASERLDLGKLAALRGESRKQVALATEDELGRDYPEFELGAVPPVGGAAQDAVVVDRLLAERETIVFEAGTHDESVRVAASDLVRIARATVADITQE
jgi:Ala-tRNA(Pro) deacylase